MPQLIFAPSKAGPAAVADAEQAGEPEAEVAAEPVIVLPAAIPPASRVRPDPEPVPEDVDPGFTDCSDATVDFVESDSATFDA